MEAIIQKPVKKSKQPATPPPFMTEEEFEAWCDEDIKAEWIEGEVIVHSPARPKHSLINLWLAHLMGSFAAQKDLGVVLGPEVQIRIPGRRRVPDLMFITAERRNIVRETYVNGAPDLAVEIVSPDSVERDWREKYHEYETAGVKEYWIIDPYSQRLRVHSLDENGRYQPLPEQNGLIHSRVLPGFWLRSTWLWQDPLPHSLDVLRELQILS